MAMADQLLKAAVRADELQDIIGRRIEIKLSIGGLTIVVGDPASRVKADTMSFLDLQTYSDNGLLADAVESCARRCDRTLKSLEP